jgi:eukaryotic-like serine/threonine-protein kinase
MLEGENLRKILDDGPLPVARAIRIAHEIASGLAYAHLEGVVHGGIKPSNIIVLRSGAVKITDFGMGQLGQAALLSGARTGCLGYMSPEQVRGDPVDHRCDIFSLGALLYEMLTHRRPFEGGSPKEITESILRGEPPPPSSLNPHVPRALDAIVSSMLAGQPAARMPGVPVLLGELQRLEEALGLEPAASVGTDEPAASPPPAGPDGVCPDPSIADEIQHPSRTTDREVFDHHRAMMQRESDAERSSRSRRAIFAALALVLVVLAVGLAEFTGLTGFMEPAGFMDASRPTAVSPVAETEEPAAPATPQASPPPAIGDARAEQELPPKPLVAESSPPAQTESSVARAPEPPVSGVAAPAQRLPRTMQPTAKVAAQQLEGTARLVIAVSPRGELYVDGKHHGTTPPTTTFHLEPGMHRIEVRSGSRKPYLTYMTVEAGDVRRIRHDFNAKPSRPPR